MQQLNSEQQKAVEHHQGPILVLAGAGTGKTRVLTNRVAHLVNHYQVFPSKILAVTFTNKATGEMRERLRAILGEDLAKRLWIATFHSMALRILRYHAKLLGFRPGFVVYDTDDSVSLMKQILKNLGVDAKKLSPKYYLQIIEWQKNDFISPNEFEPSYQQKHDKVGEVYEAYQAELLRANAMDFNDLLFYCLKLLEDYPDVRKLYQKQLEFILVDEFQDTNIIQYRIIKHLAFPQNNLLVVGDDDQSIYAFRGADIRNILSFEEDYPETQVIKLEQNYRSTQVILDAAHAVISKNKNRKDKKLWTDQANGEAVLLRAFEEAGEEADFVAETIAGKLDKRKLKDIAIFYRTNAQSRSLEEALLSAGLRYKIFGGFKFYDRKEVKDLIGYLRFLNNLDDVQALRRIINLPKRGIGVQTVQKIFNLANQQGKSYWEAVKDLSVGSSQANKKLQSFVSVIEEALEKKESLALSELLSLIVSKTKFLSIFNPEDPKDLDRLENVKELQVLAAKYDQAENGLVEFLDHIALMTATDTSVGNVEEDEDDYVSLMTLHMAKGLEFPVVFFVGLEDGLMPHSRSIDEGEVSEERRLCYVGLSRAKEELVLTYARSRGMASSSSSFGYGGYYRQPSRFLADIPSELLDSDDYVDTMYDLEGDEFGEESQDFVNNVDEIPEEYITTFNRNYQQNKKLKKQKDKPDLTSLADLISTADEID